MESHLCTWCWRGSFSPWSVPAHVQTHCHVLWSCLAFVGTFGWQASGWVTHLGSVLYLNGLAVGSASCRVFSLFRFKLCALLIFSGYSLLTLEMEGDWVNGQPEAWGSGGGALCRVKPCFRPFSFSSHGKPGRGRGTVSEAPQVHPTGLLWEK